MSGVGKNKIWSIGHRAWRNVLDLREAEWQLIPLSWLKCSHLAGFPNVLPPSSYTSASSKNTKFLSNIKVKGLSKYNKHFINLLRITCKWENNEDKKFIPFSFLCYLLYNKGSPHPPSGALFFSISKIVVINLKLANKILYI